MGFDNQYKENVVSVWKDLVTREIRPKIILSDGLDHDIGISLEGMGFDLALREILGKTVTVRVGTDSDIKLNTGGKNGISVVGM